MEDAYVIGIRLALENGVSAGIAIIAADLHALDSAIAATTANLQRLQALALSIALPGPRVQTEQSPQPPQTADPILPAPDPRPRSGGSAPSAEPSRDTGGGNGKPVVPSQPAPPIPPPVAPATSPVIRILTQTVAPHIAPVPPDAPPSQSQPKVIASAAPTKGAPAVPPVQPVATIVSAGPGPDAKAAASPIAPVLRGDRALAPAAPSPGQSAAAAPPALRPAVSSPTLASAPTAPLLSGRETQQNRDWATAATLQRPIVMAPYPSGPMAPPAREATSSTLQGDVYLDGTRLGHWVADRLARDAGRPQSGTTGFDPRLGPAWPGAQQGF